MSSGKKEEGEAAEKSWSQWLDFDRARIIQAVPESAGVCVMHANMNILYIGGGQNIRQLLLECISDPCTGKAKRFRYMLTPDYQQVKARLVKEFMNKHSGKLPACMESNRGSSNNSPE